jgi:hypothetical protein
VDAACKGVPLPVGDVAPPQPDQQGHSGSPAASPHSGTADEVPVGGGAGALKALMFDDDFTGVAETSEALQDTVDICHECCGK